MLQVQLFMLINKMMLNQQLNKQLFIILKIKVMLQMLQVQLHMQINKIVQKIQLNKQLSIIQKIKVI